MFRSSLHRLIALAWAIPVAIAALPARPAVRWARDLEPHCRLYFDPQDKFTRVMPPPRASRAPRQVVSNIQVRYTGFTTEAQIAFQAAVDIWQSQVASAVPLEVDAAFRDLGQSVLGSAGAGFIDRDFPGAPMASTFFPGALANKLAGTDRSIPAVEIHARFNSRFNWYFGVDGLTPSGRVDFISVVLHELGHGLGFAGTASVSNGQGFVGSGGAYIFDVPVVDASGVSVLDQFSYPNGSAALAAVLTGGGAFWNGANGKAANNGAPPKLYTPAAYLPGSTYSHLDESTYAPGNLDSLMTPMLGSAEAIHVPGPIVTGMFNDMGWGSVCSLGLDHAAQTVPASGATESSLKLAVGAAPTCAWTASTSSSFIHLGSGASATGSALVRFGVDANPGASLREGTITIAAANFTETQTFTVIQQGTCTYALAGTSGTAPAAGGSVSTSVTAAAGCTWSAAAAPGSFATVTSGASGSGNGTVVLTVPANTASTVRVTTLTIAGQTLAIVQDAPCSYTLSAGGGFVIATGGTVDVTVTAGNGCPWTASTSSTFITLSGGTSVANGVVSGSGNGTVAIAAVANTSATGRTATVTVAGQAYTLTQAGPPPPEMSFDRSGLVFGAVVRDAAFAQQTPSQIVRLRQTGSAAAVSWTAAANQPWVTVTPAAGVGAGTLTVGVQHAGGLPPSGSSVGTVTLTFSGALSATATIAVTLNTLTESAPPVGAFDTPASGGTGLQGSIAVTGWALDDVAVSRVEIWRDLQPGETTQPFARTPGDPRNGKVFIANGTFVDGARPDVEALSLDAPRAYRAGWGYLMLTQGLWNGGNGSYTLHAFAFDEESNVTLLGQKVITADNQAATRPFGSIDTPDIGGTITGSVVNLGWALTPLVNGVAQCRIPSNGVQVSIDSGPLQPVTFGSARADIAAAFPGLANSAGAGGSYVFDTSTLANGVHTIGWHVTDDCNRADGIGSRFFTVNNGSLTVLPPAFRLRAETTKNDGEAPKKGMGAFAFRRNDRDPVLVSRGYGELGALVSPDSTGERTVRIVQGQRIELRLPRGYQAAYQLVAGERRDLPIGAGWDAASQTLSWTPAAPFLGEYQLVFADGEKQLRVLVHVTVEEPR